MIDKINILEIRNDAIRILKKDSNLFLFYLIYYMIPILIAGGIVFWLSIKINTDLFGNLNAGISLFSGLLFSIIFIVSNNYKERRISHDSQDDENIRYLKHYHEFTTTLISLISYTIIKALYIIVFTVVISLYFEYINCLIDIPLKILWSLLIVFLYQFLLYVLIILKEIYSMQYEEINRKK